MSTSIHSLRGQIFTPFYELGGKCPHMQFLGRGQMYMLYTLIWGWGANSRLISIQFSALIFDDLKRLDYNLKRHKNVP